MIVYVECFTVLVMIVTLIQFGNKNKIGWLLSIVTNFLWIYIGIIREVPVIIIATIVYFIFNIRGYLLWRKDESKEKLSRNS